MTDAVIAGCCVGALLMGKVGPRVEWLGSQEGCGQGERGCRENNICCRG